MPLLSVCIPTWNAARYIRETLDSLLAQELIDLEIVICDDASQDETLAIAGCLEDRRLRIVAHEQRLGLAGNWSRAFQQARGEFLCLFGQDDLASSQWAASLCGLLQRNPEASLAFGRRQFLFEDEETRRVLGDFFERRYPEMLAPFYARIGEVVHPDTMRAEAMRYCFEVNLIGEPSFVIVRRDHPAVTAGFDPRLRQLIDWEFYTRFFLDRCIVRTETIVGTYRLHAAGASKENAPISTHYREYGHLLQVVLDRFRAVLSDEERQALVTRRVEVQRLLGEWARRSQGGEGSSPSIG